jgi:hypothetical protein
MYAVNALPCIASTYSLIPVNDVDALAIISGAQALTAEDVLAFSFFPHQPLNNSICVISWLRGSKRAQRLLDLNRINQLPEKEQLDTFLSFAFQSPNIYISPTWWQTLSEEERKGYKEVHRDASRGFYEFV